MKNNLIYLLLLIFCFSCQENDLKMYSGQNAIQLDNEQDSLLHYTFFFQDPSVSQDTVWLKFRTTGYTSGQDRTFTLKQFEVEGVRNAEAGVHYKELEQQDIRIAKDSVFAHIPVVLLRSSLDERGHYFLGLKLEADGNFILGEEDKLKTVIEFSRAMMKPSAWTDYWSKYFLGEWSYNKHVWLVEQTHHNWDDEFLSIWKDEPGLPQFWRDKLNELLKQYNDAGNVLVDDAGVEITGFPN